MSKTIRRDFIHMMQMHLKISPIQRGFAFSANWLVDWRWSVRECSYHGSADLL